MRPTTNIAARTAPRKKRGLGEVSSSTASGYATAAVGVYDAIKNASRKPKGQQVIRYNGFEFGRTQDLEKTGVTSTALKAVGAGLAAYTYGISLILTLVPSEAYEKTIARLFKNGAGFKCWNSSWAPSKAKSVLEIEIPAIKNEAQKVLKAPIDQFENSVNSFMRFFYAIHSTDRDWLKTSAKACTKHGLMILIKALDLAKTQMVTAFTEYAKKMGGKLQKVGTIKQVYPPEKSGRHALTQEVEQYKFTPPTSNALASNIEPQNTGNIAPQNTGYLANVANAPVAEAGFSPIAAVLLAALAGGTYLYSKN